MRFLKENIKYCEDIYVYTNFIIKDELTNEWFMLLWGKRGNG